MKCEERAWFHFKVTNKTLVILEMDGAPADVQVEPSKSSKLSGAIHVDLQTPGGRLGIGTLKNRITCEPDQQFWARKVRAR